MLEENQGWILRALNNILKDFIFILYIITAKVFPKYKNHATRKVL